MMSTDAPSAGTAAQLIGLGIPADEHNSAALRRLIPAFEGLDQVEDVEALAKVVVYLARHGILSATANAWRELPWGTHACLFYRSNAELDGVFRAYFREGLLSGERCCWVVSRTYNPEKAQALRRELLAETGRPADAFDLVRHQDWYDAASGRLRTRNEILMGWLGKIEAALHAGHGGLRVAGDAHCHPDDLKDFFDYEAGVNAAVGTLKIKALCTYCIPRFAADQIKLILQTHQSAFGDLALSGR